MISDTALLAGVGTSFCLPPHKAPLLISMNLLFKTCFWIQGTKKPFRICMYQWSIHCLIRSADFCCSFESLPKHELSMHVWLQAWKVLPCHLHTHCLAVSFQLQKRLICPDIVIGVVFVLRTHLGKFHPP